MRKILRLPVLLAALIVLYTASMLAVYVFPDEWIKPRTDAAIVYLEEEGNMPGGYAKYFWHSGFGITDNLTDKEIYKGLLRNGRSVADAAMRTDYPRYWHGYAVILRPLSVVLSIIHIRYLNMMFLMMMLMLCYVHCRRRFGTWAAFCFAAGLLMSFFLIAPFCQQYCPVYMLALSGCYVLLRFWEKLRKWLPELFLTLGSLVCFFDFLTFPVLALGYPLLICLLLSLKDGESAVQLWKRTIWLSSVWMGAYALTWLSKALAGGMLTGENVLADILEQVAFRTTGAFIADGRDIEITAETAIAINLETFFNGSNVAFLALMLLVLGVRMLFRRKPWKEWLRALPVVAVAAYPFIWYCVMQNHVRMHFWMTHKQLSVTVFALYAAVLAVTRGGLQGEKE